MLIVAMNSEISPLLRKGGVMVKHSVGRPSLKLVGRPCPKVALKKGRFGPNRSHHVSASSTITEKKLGIRRILSRTLCKSAISNHKSAIFWWSSWWGDLGPKSPVSPVWAKPAPPEDKPTPPSPHHHYGEKTRNSENTFSHPLQILNP